MGKACDGGQRRAQFTYRQNLLRAQLEHSAHMARSRVEKSRPFARISVFAELFRVRAVWRVKVSGREVRLAAFAFYTVHMCTVWLSVTHSL